MSSKANDQRLLYGRGGEHCLCRPDLQKSTQEKHHPGSPGRKENIHFMGQGGRFDSASCTSRWAGLDLLSHRLEPRAGTAAALLVTLGCAGARAVQSVLGGLERAGTPDRTLQQGLRACSLLGLPPSSPC